MAYRNQNRRNNQGGNFNNNNNNFRGGNNNINPWNNNNNDGPMMGNQAMVNQLMNMLRNQGGNIPSLVDNMNGGGFNRGGGGGGGYNDNFNRGGGRNMPNNNNRRNRVVKGAIRKPNAPNRKTMGKKNFNNSKQNDSATDPTTNNKNTNDARNQKDGKVEEGSEHDKELKRKNSPYSDVPNNMFYCHMCAKHMWDSTSFENHLKGRTHSMMKEGVLESYRMKAKMMRQEAKIGEQLKSIEIERLKRLGKAIRAANQNREYCNMCELQFYGHLSTHRKSDSHLELKKFLHPRCDDCNIEFHNRPEYDTHLLSAEHMKTCKTPPSYKSEESRRNRLQILTEADETVGLRDEKPKKKEVKEGEATVSLAGDGEKKECENSEPMETDAVEEGENGEQQQQLELDTVEEIEPILDYMDGDSIGTEIEGKIPKYSCKRQVGFSLISKLTCFECRLCNKYFDTESTAEIHSRTFNHHRLFVKFLNEKANETKIAEKRAAAAAAEETERQKRIKLDSEAEGQQQSIDEPKDEELYDPNNATDDDKDEITDAPMNEVATEVEKKEETAPATVTSEPEPVAVVVEPAAEEKKPIEEPTTVAAVVTPAPTPVAVVTAPTPVPAPATPAPQQTPQQQNNTPQQQNNTPQQQQQNNQQHHNNQQQTPNRNFNNNRGRGRGGYNNNRRSGRNSGRF